MECPSFHIPDVELESRLQGYRIGMVANFSCPFGFELDGPDKVMCLNSGEFSWGKTWMLGWSEIDLEISVEHNNSDAQHY